jgi:hypothetical protein
MLARRGIAICFTLASAAACNWLAGIDARETAPASGGSAGAMSSGGHAGRGPGGAAGVGESTTLGGAGEPGTGENDHSGGMSHVPGSGDNAAGDGGMAGATDSGTTGHGGAPSAGGTHGSAGTPASTGGAGAGMGGSAGVTGNAGVSGSAGTAGSGGTTDSALCTRQQAGLVTSDWYITTGGDLDGETASSIEPLPTGTSMFQDVTCACVTGTRAPDSWGAFITFQKGAGMSFSKLNIELSAEVGTALPTLYVRTKDDHISHCLVLSDDEAAKAYQGAPLSFDVVDFNRSSPCKTDAPDLEAGVIIDSVILQFDVFEPLARSMFHVCVLNLDVN